MISFKNVKIGEIGKVVTGRTPKTDIQDNFGKDYMFLGPTDLHESFKIKTSEKMLSAKGLESIKSSAIDGISICVGCIGSDMGNVGLVIEKCATNQQINSITRIKENIYNPFYIYYWLKGKKKFLFNLANVTTTPILNKTDFSNIEINLPTKTHQDKVANFLKLIDEKKVINNKVNIELEAIAKLIYDYWFVQFDYPDENGKPYKSSGGKMVFNEDLKREIPQGWKVIELGDYIDFQKGISYSSKNIGVSGTPMINLDSFFLDGSYKNEGLKYFNGKVNNDRLCKKGDLVIAVTDVTRNAEIIGKGFSIPDLFDEDVLISTDVAKVELSDQLTKEYILQLFNSENYHNYIKHFATGTLVLHLDLNGIRWSKIALPPMELQKKYSEISRSAQLEFANSIKENQSLIKLRDWLLPMLMNGQITISEAS